MVVKFDFNCILVDKDGIHHIDLDAADPLASLSPPKQGEVPNPQLGATVGVATAA